MWLSRDESGRLKPRDEPRRLRSQNHSKVAGVISQTTGGSTLASVLMGGCIGWLAFYWFPSGPPRQTVIVQDSPHPTQRYLVPMDEPSLSRLRQSAERKGAPSSTPGLRLAKWHRELAAYYRQQTQPSDRTPETGGDSPAEVTPISCSGRPSPASAEAASASAEIQPVSHTAARRDRADRQGGAEDEPLRQRQLEHDYWCRLETSSQRRIEAAEAALRRYRESERSPAVTLGPIVPTGRPPIAIGFGLCAAMAGFTVARWHRNVCPPVALEPLNSERVSTAETGLLRLQLPPDWVRIRQPVAVRVRRTAAAAIVAAALFCAARQGLGY